MEEEATGRRNNKTLRLEEDEELELTGLLDPKGRVESGRERSTCSVGMVSAPFTGLRPPKAGIDQAFRPGAIGRPIVSLARLGVLALRL